MFINRNDCRGGGTGAPLGWGAIELATRQARLRPGGVAGTGDLPTRRAEVEQLI